MARSINWQLTEFNCRLLPSGWMARQHQLMVENSLAARLGGLIAQKRTSRAELARIADVSLQSVHKWLKKDGRMSEAHARKIARAYGLTTGWLLHGEPPPVRQIGAAQGLTALALDIARRWSELSEDRREWFRDLIFSMHQMEKRIPALRKARPRGEGYANLDRDVEDSLRQPPSLSAEG